MKKNVKPRDTRTRAVELTFAEREFIRGRFEVESSWGLEVYDQGELDLMESVSKKLGDS